jgi:succinyl-CoA synthetase beta subunit
LAPDQPVREAEINPLLVKADGVVALDALMVLKEDA